MKDMMVYIKTTETCNLNCKHCFTNGINGSKIYWNPLKTVAWLYKLATYTRNISHMHVEFHGGEPFLVPLHTMQFVYDNCNGLWKSQSWGVTSNLVFKLKEDKIDFILGPLQARVGTSWDPKIRFANTKQYDLWERNVHTLIERGVDVKLNISVTSDTVNIEPIELLKWVRDLGVKEMALERLTNNGSAVKNPEIFPSNIDLDKWFKLMHEQTQEYDARSWFVNEFLETVYDKFEHGMNNSGTFCRDCEQKLFTVNADGSIAGCPNSAPEDYFGHLDDSMEDLFNQPKRIKNIACEVARDPRCYTCEVFNYCNSDCRQLGWDGDICAAPKSLMKSLL